MDKLKTRAVAGTLESSDVYVEIQPGDGKLNIDLKSVVINQFGTSIINVVEDVCKENSIDDADIKIVDRGALECVIRARVETAICRAKGE